MKNILEKCRKCKDSKSILKEIYFYGKVAYICKDCEREADSNRRPQAYESRLVTSTFCLQLSYKTFYTTFIQPELIYF